MQVKLNRYHWGIQGTGKGRTENRWDVSGAGQTAPPEVYIIFPR
jgi:hypothetical protein